MALSQIVSLSITAASANAIALAQSAGAAGNLTLNGAAASGGVATLDAGRRVLITSVGNDSGRAFTIYGTNQTGSPISETLVGGNAAAVQSQFDYLTVNRVAINGASAGNVTVGTSGIATSPWKNVNPYGTNNVSFACIVQGAVNYSIEYTYDDINNNQRPSAPPIPTPWLHPVLHDLSITQEGTLGPPAFSAWRVKINSGLGVVTVTAVQSNILGMGKY